MKTHLNKLFADNFVVYFKAHSAHFNVEGPSFLMHHEQLQEVYEYLYEQHDILGELIRQQGIYAPPTLKDVLEESSVPEEGMLKDAGKIYPVLVEDMEELCTLAQALYKSCGSGAIETVIGDYMVGLSKLIWKLKAQQGKVTV